MESISQLRTICQKPKVSDREDIGMSYQDLKAKLELGVSIYFTWVFIRFGISANSVTYLSGIAAIIGGIFLSFENIWFALIGIIFLEIYNLLDYCDGEISRYHKKGSIQGWFLDWYMLFVRDGAMFIGLAVAANILQPSLFMVICSFLAVITPFMDKAIIGCGWTVLSWQRLVEIQNSELVKLQDNKESKTIDDQNQNYKKNKSNKRNFFYMIGLIKRIWHFSISIFEHHWSLLVLFIILLIQLFINYILLIPTDLRPYLIIYVGIYGPIYVLIRLYRTLRLNSFEYKYNLLFHNKNDVKATDYIF